MSASTLNLKGRLDRRLFNLDEFKKADTVEKCFMHLVAGPASIFQLTEVQAEYLLIMEDAYALIKEYRDASLARKMLISRIPKVSARRYSAIQVIHDAQRLFGCFEEVDRRVQRGIIRQNLIERIRFCEAEKDDAPDKIRPQYEKLIQDYWKQLANLDCVSEQDAVVVDTSLPEVSFTNDPAALRDGIDTDYEEV